MKAKTLRDYLVVHTWVGIVSGLLLFIAFYAGAFAMLEPEITRWTQEPLTRVTPSSDADKVFEQFLVQQPQAQGRLSLRLATPEQPFVQIKLVDLKKKEHWFELDPQGVIRKVGLPLDGDSSGNFVDYLHRKGGLPLPLEWAEPLIGLISLLYALALVSGVVVLLPSLVKDLFHLRLGANIKRKWLDVHNLLGVASLPFHIVIALSAAVFGLHDWIYAAQDKLVYKDGLQATVKRDSFEHPNIARELWRKPSELVAHVRASEPGFEPQVLDYVGFGGKRTLLFMAGKDDQHFKRGAQFGYAFVNLGSGEIYDRTYFPGTKNSALGSSLVSFFSLHFGSFGGNPVRLLYVLLGLSGALLFYTGNLLWIESRTKRSRTPEQQLLQRPRHVRLLSALTLGVCLGCAAGLPTMIALSRWLAPWAGASHIDLVHQTSFYAVFAACLLWAGLRGTQRAATGLLWLTAACNALVPLTAITISFASPALDKPYQSGFALLELLCLALAMFFAWLAHRHPRTRPLNQLPGPSAANPKLMSAANIPTET